MNETGKQLLTVLDRALTESPREAAAREGRTLLKQIHTRFGPEVAQRYAGRILSPGARAEMRALLDTAPAKAPTPARTAEVPPLLPPKPTPARIETATLKRILFVSVQGHLPVDFCAMDEDKQRRSLLIGCWKLHAEGALPASLGPEVEAATAGLRRSELAGSVRTVSAFARESIKRELRKAKLAIK